MKAMIKMNLTVDKVNKVCNICDAFDFDVNIVSGRMCVDGKSVMGVMKMCGRDVVVIPVTDDEDMWDQFFQRLSTEVGAYKE